MLVLALLRRCCPRPRLHALTPVARRCPWSRGTRRSRRTRSGCAAALWRACLQGRGGGRHCTFAFFFQRGSASCMCPAVQGSAACFPSLSGAYVLQHSTAHSAAPALTPPDCVLCAPQRADAEAAKVYEEFVQSFGDANESESKSAPRAFVRGGTIQPGSSAAAAALAAGASLPSPAATAFPLLTPNQLSGVMRALDLLTLRLPWSPCSYPCHVL